MREATGNALLTMMITTIIGVIMMFFVGSISYSKSYKIKNYIVKKIESNGGWSIEDGGKENIQTEVDSYMKETGYNVSKSSCPRNDKCGESINTQISYNYCIYKCSKGNYTYYKVRTYMIFDFPIIGDMIKFEVNGETKNTSNWFG